MRAGSLGLPAPASGTWLPSGLAASGRLEAGFRSLRSRRSSPLPAASRAPVAALGIAFGGDDVGVQFVGFPQLFLGAGTDVLGFLLPFAGFLPQALGLDFRLLRVGLGAGGLRLALPRADLFGLGLFTHFGGLVAVRFHLALAADAW